MENRQRRILIVDDQADVAGMLALMLGHEGYRTTIAFSATEALDAAKTESFDLVLSDIAMPKMNGYELAEALRALPKYRRVPLIAVTGLSVHNDRERSIEAGFNAHLSKPISPQLLIEITKRLLVKR